MNSVAKPSLNSDDWARARALFEQAIDLPHDERDRFVRACGDDDVVRDEVLALLSFSVDADGAAEDFLDRPADTAWQPAPRDGLRLGPWQLESLLGVGGMGEVYRARRADGGYTASAAVKILKRGMDSVGVLKRFALEQQALATLNHPHIARLFDAGLTPDGLPYFVMELVEGNAIVTACERLPLADRLQTFLQLADAVAYAHRMLLVHRDLKPGNVFVTSSGQVKLLDFGIAQALDQAGAPADLTGNAQPLFTPSHASPEQVRGERVGTATDIYSLGVLLYQLLTGTLPTGRQAVNSADAARGVLEDVPVRPSSLEPSSTSPSDWLAVRRSLQGDLDNIVLKALEKLVERRYASVDALVADVQAYLHGYPVSAHAPSVGYVAAKFMRRHRWAVVAAALGSTGLVTGLAAAMLQGRAAAALGLTGMAAALTLALVQGRKAVVARDQALARFDDVRQLAHAIVFDYHDLIEALPGATPVRKRLVNDALVYLERLVLVAPKVRAVRREMGAAYRVVGTVQCNGSRRPHLGDPVGALRSYERSIAILEEIAIDDPQDADTGYQLALSLSARSALLGQGRDLVAAQAGLIRAEALFTRHLPRDTPDLSYRVELARTHLRLAAASLHSEDLEGARASLERGRKVLEGLAAIRPDHHELAHLWVWVNNMTAQTARECGDWPTVTRMMLRSRDILVGLHAREPDNARFREDLAGNTRWLLMATGPQGDLANAERWGNEACERYEALVRRDPEDRNAFNFYLDALILSGAQLVLAGAPERGLRRLTTVRPTLIAAMRRWATAPEVRARELLLVQSEVFAKFMCGDAAGAAASLAEGRSTAKALQRTMAAHPLLRTASALIDFAQAKMLALGVLRSDEDDADARAEAIAALQSCVLERRTMQAERMLETGHWGLALREASALLARLQGSNILR